MKTLKNSAAPNEPAFRVAPLAIAVSTLLGLGGCVIAVKDSDDNRERSSHHAEGVKSKGISQLNDGQLHEMCRVLMAGETIHFDFEASAPVSFNLHYHEGEKVTYPVEEQLLSAINNRFTAPLEQTYCLMWTGKESDTKLVYHYSIES